jgi:hypothetical protein
MIEEPEVVTALIVDREYFERLAGLSFAPVDMNGQPLLRGFMQ